MAPEDLSRLLWKYHSLSAARRRLRLTVMEDVYGPLEDIYRDLESIRALVPAVVNTAEPQVSVVIPAYNEEVELIPTVLSFLWAIAEARLPAEIVTVDNMSSDRTRELALRMAVKNVQCTTAGLRFARAAGLAEVHSAARYVWLVDADTRVVAPLKRAGDLSDRPNPLRISYDYMEKNPTCVATSTGIAFEFQIVLRRAIRSARILLNRGQPYSCWSGANQFIRKECLLAVGGIDLDVDGGEDHHRIFELVRYAKPRGRYLKGADSDGSLLAPVYTSDRRNATVAAVCRNLTQQLRKPKYPRDEYGLPMHPKGVRHKDLHKRERGKAAGSR